MGLRKYLMTDLTVMRGMSKITYFVHALTLKGNINSRESTKYLDVPSKIKINDLSKF